MELSIIFVNLLHSSSLKSIIEDYLPVLRLELNSKQADLKKKSRPSGQRFISKTHALESKEKENEWNIGRDGNHKQNSSFTSD